MKFEIYQISLTDEMVMVLNSRMSLEQIAEHSPKCLAHRDTMLGKNLEQHFKDGHYSLVARIEAENLNQVFEIGNVGPEDQITHIAPMHSVSVGDVILDENGVFHTVDSFGFGVINP